VFFKHHQSPVSGSAEPTSDDLAFLAEHAGEPGVGPQDPDEPKDPSEFQVAAGMITVAETPPEEMPAEPEPETAPEETPAEPETYPVPGVTPEPTPEPEAAPEEVTAVG
jgi:hypothetical protein